MVGWLGTHTGAPRETSAATTHDEEPQLISTELEVMSARSKFPSPVGILCGGSRGVGRVCCSSRCRWLRPYPAMASTFPCLARRPASPPASSSPSPSRAHCPVPMNRGEAPASSHSPLPVLDVAVTTIRVLPLPRPLPLAASAGPYWPHATSSARAPAVAAFGHQTTPPRPPVAVLRHPRAPIPPAAIVLRPRARSTRRARASAALTAAPPPSCPLVAVLARLHERTPPASLRRRHPTVPRQSRHRGWPGRVPYQAPTRPCPHRPPGQMTRGAQPPKKRRIVK